MHAPRAQSSVHGPRHPNADLLRSGARPDLERSAVQVRELPTLSRRHTLFDKQMGQLALHGVADAIAVARRETMKYKLLDVQLDVHTQPLISASVRGFSSLAYSLRAACNRCIMHTGRSASAARNAAFNAMLRMFPPATLSWASLPGSNPSVGVSDGKMRRQISARCAVSGNGNCTINRMRLRNAGSSAFFMLVVRIARPR